MITGESYAPRPKYFHNLETSENYWSIVRALAFPTNRTPGFAVIVAAIRNGAVDDPVFKVITEIEESDIDTLLQTCERRRYRYGYPHQLECFYGDPERFMSIVSVFNHNNEQGLYLTLPADFQAPNRSEIYLERIWSNLKSESEGNKRLVLGGCERLRANLQNLPKDIQKIEDSPAVAALGYVVHSLESIKPWKQALQPEPSRPTVEGEILEAMDEDGFDFGDVEEYDHDGSLINTVGKD